MKVIISGDKVSIDYVELMQQINEIYGKQLEMKELNYDGKIRHKLEVTLELHNDEFPNVEVVDLIGTHNVTHIETIKVPGVKFSVKYGEVTVYVRESGKMITFQIDNHKGIIMFYSFKDLIPRKSKYNQINEKVKTSTIEIESKWSDVVKDTVWKNQIVNIKGTKAKQSQISNAQLTNTLFSKLLNVDRRGIFFRKNVYGEFLKFCQKNS